MACVLPPELDDSEILAYLDSEAEDQVGVHLEQCPDCRARVERLRRLQRYLTAGLRQNVCPPPSVLGEYHLGLLPEDWVPAVGQHLVECPHCRQEVTQLQADLDELDAELAFSPLEQIKVWFAQLVGGGRQTTGPRVPALAPAYTGVRGEEEPPRLYQAGKAEIRIEVQEDARQPDRKELLGFVTGIDPSGLQAHLWREEKCVAEAGLDELGNFSLVELMPGRYELILSGPEVEIHVQELDVGTG
jgi:hypothetical protein